MKDLKPRILDRFRLHKGEICGDVVKSRIFNEPLWNRMKNGDYFVFDQQRGLREEPDCPDFVFPMCEYLLSRDRGLHLSEILGPDVKIVTQRNLLKNLVNNIMSTFPSVDSMEFYCERFGNVIFIKQIETRFDLPIFDFLDKRRQFFTGDDLPGCIGSTPVSNFQFPDVGKAYAVLSLQSGEARIVYSCTVHHFSPGHEPVDSTIVRDRFMPNESKRRTMLEKAATDGFNHHMYFMMRHGSALMNFVDTEKALQKHPQFREALGKAMDLLLDKRLMAFLSMRRCCMAKLERIPELRLRPATIPATYKSFLSKEFFLRFFDDED